MTPADLAECCTLIAGYWPAWQPTPAAIFAAERQWLDLDRAVVVAAIDSLSSEAREFAPPVGVVRARAVDLAARAAGAGIPDVDEAWAAVMTLVRTRGWYDGSPAELPEPARTVAEAIGWDRLCHDDNQTALLAQFRDLFKVAAPRATREQVMTPAGRELIAGLAGQLESKRRELDP